MYNSGNPKYDAAVAADSDHELLDWRHEIRNSAGVLVDELELVRDSEARKIAIEYLTNNQDDISVTVKKIETYTFNGSEFLEEEYVGEYNFNEDTNEVEAA